MGSQKSKLAITSHPTHRTDAGKRLMNQDSFIPAFLPDSTDARYRESQEKLGWTDAKCEEMADTAQEVHT